MERFLRQQGMRKEQIEREMEKAYEQYFSTLAKKEGNEDFRSRILDISFHYGVIRRQTGIFVNQ